MELFPFLVLNEGKEGCSRTSQNIDFYTRKMSSIKISATLVMLIEQFGAIQKIYIIYIKYKHHLQSMLPAPKELIISSKLIYTREEDLQKWKTIFCGVFLSVNAGRKPLFF